MKKRIISTLIVLSIILSQIIITQTNSYAAATTGTVNGLNWSYDSTTDSVTITKKVDTQTTIIIPSQIDIGGGVLKPVKAIGNAAFAECIKLSSVTIPDTVTSIGRSAFERCSVLTSITIPNCVISIGDRAFVDCRKLSSVSIPNSVTSIGKQAFLACTSLTSITIPDSISSINWQTFGNCSSLTSVTIPNSVTSINFQAFFYCTSLTSITIPKSVTSIDGTAFYNCTSLANFAVDNQNPNYSTIDGVLFNKNKTELIRYPIGKNSTNVTIPNFITSIGDNAFEGCSVLTSVTIPNSVTLINGNAFDSCKSLTNITIPKSVTSIGGAVFRGCSSLTKVTLNSNALVSDPDNLESFKFTFKDPKKVTIYSTTLTAENISKLIKAGFKVDKGSTQEKPLEPTGTSKYDIFTNVSNYNEVHVMLNGKFISFKNKPVIKDKKVMLPMQEIFTKLGAKVTFNSKTSTLKATYGKTSVTLKGGDKFAVVNNKKIQLDFPAKSTNGDLMVPVRFVVETLSCNVYTDQDEIFSIIIESKSNINKKVYAVTEADKILKGLLDKYTTVKYYKNDNDPFNIRFYYFAYVSKNPNKEDYGDYILFDKYTGEAYDTTSTIYMKKIVKATQISEKEARDILNKTLALFFKSKNKSFNCMSYGTKKSGGKDYYEFDITFAGASGPNFICYCYVDKATGKVYLPNAKKPFDDLSKGLIAYTDKKLLEYYNRVVK